MWHHRPMTSATRSTRNVQTSRAAVVRTLTLERVRNYDLRSTGRYRPRKERGTARYRIKINRSADDARIIRIMEIQIAEIAQYERPAWGVPGTHVSGIINMHILVRKKPRVRASAPATTRAAPRDSLDTGHRDPRVATRPTTAPSHRSTVSSNATINIAARYLQKLHAKSAPRRSDATAGPTRPGARSHSGTSRISSRRCTA